MPQAIQKNRRITPLPITIVCVLAILVNVHGQGITTFNSSSGLSSTYYQESGMLFQVVIPQGSAYDDIGIVGPIPAGGNVPQNATPYMLWFRQFNPNDYVSFSLTDGSSFGLSSVQLADPNSPSPSPVSISFIGYLSGGSTVTQTFTTPGSDATSFANYTFNSDFASELTKVDILAPRWAMDNLVFAIPEPSAGAIALLALCGGCCYRRWRGEQS